MFDHKTILDKAVDDGVINADQRWKLAPYFEGGIAEAKTAELDVSLDAPRDLGLAKQIEESEAPRFIRGFHDVLITIGLVIALIGLSALTNVIFVLVGAWVLAEVLVKRQRLALPAVALTLIYAGNALFAVFLYSETFILEYSVELKILIVAACSIALLVPFYWRFRVPISLAAMITSGLVLAFALALYLVSLMINISDVFTNAPFIFNAIGFIAAAILFAIAMWFDLKDRLRQKRWSDVAFWLHLITAPLLLYSFVSIILYQNAGAFWWSTAPQVTDAFIVVVCVLGMMLVGLVIDRRAFVTSGLISLIVASTIIFDKTSMSWGDTTSVALLIVGLLVLSFGVGWHLLRRLLLRVLPRWIVQAVPPVS